MALSAKNPPTVSFEAHHQARSIIAAEAEALRRLANQLPAGFDEAVRQINACAGAVLCSGIGKAGWIAQKVSATLASTGTPSHFLHPAEAMHGDLGRIQPNDLVLMFSNSGETGEVLNLLPTFRKRGTPLISVVATEDNSLARASDVVLAYGRHAEACTLGLAPSTTTTVMLALGDALALVASRQSGFQATDFARHHPGGSLGVKLSTVDDMMRPLEQCRIAVETESVRSIYVRLGGPQRRSGAILLINNNGQLTGIFTDSDLARLMERQEDYLLDGPVSEVMTAQPKTIVSGSKTGEAVELLSAYNLSELPVICRQGRPLGLIEITDLVSVM